MKTKTPTPRAITVNPPQVPDLMQPGNLLTAGALNGGLRVLVPAWEPLFPLDVVSLLLDQVELGSFTVDDPASQVFPIEFTLPLDSVLETRPYVLNCHVESPLAGQSGDSDITLTLNRIPPHQGNVPDAPQLPAEVADSGILSAGYLAANGDQLPITVPRYGSMEAGQQVHLVWAHAFPVPAVDVTQAEVDAGVVPASIPGEVIRAAGDGKHELHYYLSSRSGFDGHGSLGVVLDVLTTAPGGSEGLPTLAFPDRNEQGWLLIEVVENGLRVHVPPYEGMHAGDEVILDWQTFASTDVAPGTEIAGTEFTTSLIVGITQMVVGMDFVVPYEQCIAPLESVANQMGSGQAVYRVKQAGIDYAGPGDWVPIDLGRPFERE